jgi:hypothetical protein
MPKVLCVAMIGKDHDIVCDDGMVYPFLSQREDSIAYHIASLQKPGEVEWAGMTWGKYADQEFDSALREPAENIYDYYVERLNDAPDDDSLYDLPVDSGCGEPCKDAIDYASGLLRHLKDAHGNNKPHLEQQLLNVVNDIVVSYWRG